MKKPFACALALLGIVASLLSPVAGSAAPAMYMSITADSPTTAAVTLINTSSTACQVATNAFGALTFARISQHNTPIQPIPTQMTFVEALDETLLGSLKTLQPGERATIPLHATSNGQQVTLTTVAWSKEGGITAKAYHVQPHTPLTITARYALPVTPQKGERACPAVSGTTTSESSAKRTLVLATGVIIVLGAAAVWLHKRHRHSQRLAE